MSNWENDKNERNTETATDQSQRSDRDIKNEIDRQISQQGVDTTNLKVEVNNYTVTLSGSVPDLNQKRLVDRIASSTNGVKNVHNDLKAQQERPKDKNFERLIGCGTIRHGMVVVGKSGKNVGSVKELHDQNFLVARPLARDISIPYNACMKIEHDEKLYLNVPADQVDKQGWAEPKML